MLKSAISALIQRKSREISSRPRSTVKSHVLSTINGYFRTSDIARRIRAQEEDHLRNLLRRTDTVQRYNWRQLRFCLRRQDIGLDLAWRDRVDANPEWRVVMRHLARQAGQRGLRGCIG